LSKITSKLVKVHIHFPHPEKLTRVLDSIGLRPWVSIALGLT
jgi:hypothetical protein